MRDRTFGCVLAWVIAAAAVGCGGPQDAQDPRALAAPPDAKVPYSSMCAVEHLSITGPAWNKTQQEVSSLQGRVDSSCAEVWLIVHPVGTLDFYVQPKATVRSNGTWLGKIELREIGGSDRKVFEVLALANLSEALEPDQKLSGWPEASAHSDVVVIDIEPARPSADSAATSKDGGAD